MWLLVDAVAVLFARSHMLARTRAISHVSPMVRMLGMRDHTHSEAALLERELAVFRSHRRHPPPGRRPHYAPEERSEILQIGRLQGLGHSSVGRFKEAVRLLGTTPVRCRVCGWQLNAKVERQFRTMKHWRRRAVLPLGRRALQRRLDAYRHWYNDLRPHAAHAALTPADASVNLKLPEPVVYRRHGDTERVISVRRRHVRGDPYLFLPKINCQTKRRDAA